MKHVLALTAFWKKVDIIFQCVLFLIMLIVVCCTPLNIFGLYVMATGQIISAVLWFFSLKESDAPQLRSAKRIRSIFLVTGTILIGALMLNMGVFVWISICMLLIGPVLGISYFTITISEYRFYANARKPYYLL